MSEVVLLKHRIRPGKTDRVREWYATVAERKDEALATLADEEVYTEAAFVERGEDADYLVSFMEAADVEAAFEAFEESDHAIDREFRQLLDETVEEFHVGEHESLYYLAAPERP